MKRLACAVLMGATLSSASLIAVAPPAAASTTDCAKGYFCLWDDKNYSDRRIDLSHAASDLGISEYKFNDKASSVYNHTSQAWKIYDDKNFQDRAICLNPGATIPDLGVSAYKFNDKTSSAKPVGTRC